MFHSYLTNLQKEPYTVYCMHDVVFTYRFSVSRTV